MEQSRSHDTKSQETPCILQNLTVDYFYKCLPPVPIVRHVNQVNASPPYFLKTHLNIILSSTPSSSKKHYTIMNLK